METENKSQNIYEKPKLIFFRMHQCDHCDYFLENIWGALAKDPELRNDFDFTLYNFGYNSNIVLLIKLLILL